MTLLPFISLTMGLPLSPRPRRAISALALLWSLGGAAALAQPVGPESRGQRLTPAQQAKIFPDQRRLALQDHQERIAILKQGESCLNGAKDTDALHQCLRKELDALRDQRRRQNDALRAVYQKNGLPVPQYRRLAKPHRAMPGGPGSDT
jgi:hypothetical protein